MDAREITGAPSGANAAPSTPVCDAALFRAFALLGKRWSGVILGTLAHGPAGYADLARAVDGICDSVLAERLGELARAGLVVRTVAPGPPVAVTYQLSDAGAALVPVLHGLGAWATEHLVANELA